MKTVSINLNKFITGNMRSESIEEAGVRQKIEAGIKWHLIHVLGLFFIGSFFIKFLVLHSVNKKNY